MRGVYKYGLIQGESDIIADDGLVNTAIEIRNASLRKTRYEFLCISNS